MEYKVNGLEFSSSMKKDSNPRKRLIREMGILIAVMLGGSIACCAAIDCLSIGICAPILIAGVGTGLCLLSMLSAEEFKKYASVLPIVWALIALGLYKFTSASLIVLINELLELRGSHNGTVALMMSSSIKSPILALMIVFAFLAMIAVLVIKYLPILGPVMALPMWFLIGTGYVNQSVWIVVYTLSCFLVLLNRESLSFSPEVIRNSAAMQCLVSLMIVSIVCVPIALLSKCETAALKERIEREIHEVRYEKGENQLSEGYFSSDRSFNPSEKEVLKVTMSAPTSMYLRSYVGDRYTDFGWASIENQEIFKYSSLFYYLHKNEFYGESQTSTLRNILGLSGESIQVQIENLGGCSQHLLVPYGLSKNEILNSKDIGDDIPNAEGFRGERAYGYSLLTENEAKAYDILKELEKNKTKPELANYVEDEKNYREFVYENYLEVPESFSSVFEGLEDARAKVCPEERQLTTYEAKYLVRDYLNDRANYRAASLPKEGGVQLIKDFLNGKAGNSEQYATVTVLLLREVGIPARYVEGYLISQKDVEGKEGPLELTLTNASSHAWAEYYEDGVGWFPLETIPAYVGTMKESGWPWLETNDNKLSVDEKKSENSSVSDNDGAGNSSQTMNESPDETEKNEIHLLEDSSAGKENPAELPIKLILKIALFIGLILVLLGVLAIRRKIILNKREKEFTEGSIEERICRLFNYSLLLMYSSGFENKNVAFSNRLFEANEWFGEENEFLKMARLNAEVRFSNHCFDENHLTEMNAYRIATLQRFINKLNRKQRIYQKWICCKY